ncbi:hypothetical protein M7I_5375 [Glarea lozoyensis 74030]|uniref:Uncharacterized protein n=1 Tax=Glarea lozoyensis (strain ATCC 74030 / MF5533) TaxID=1104152 RepID=H0ERQ4_GLAL7|nr:hypothetical protein M7I_5375 [Glarea lozoyensis 74030]
MGFMIYVLIQHLKALRKDIRKDRKIIKKAKIQALLDGTQVRMEAMLAQTEAGLEEVQKEVVDTHPRKDRQDESIDEKSPAPTTSLDDQILELTTMIAELKRTSEEGDAKFAASESKVVKLKADSLQQEANNTFNHQPELLEDHARFCKREANLVKREAAVFNHEKDLVEREIDLVKLETELANRAADLVSNDATPSATFELNIRLLADKAELEAQVVKIECEVRQYRDQLSASEASRERLLDNVDELNAENAEYRDQDSKREAEFAKLRSEVIPPGEEISFLKSKLEELHDKAIKFDQTKRKLAEKESYCERIQRAECLYFIRSQICLDRLVQSAHSADILRSKLKLFVDGIANATRFPADSDPRFLLKTKIERAYEWLDDWRNRALLRYDSSGFILFEDLDNNESEHFDEISESSSKNAPSQTPLSEKPQEVSVAGSSEDSGSHTPVSEKSDDEFVPNSSENAASHITMAA